MLNALSDSVFPFTNYRSSESVGEVLVHREYRLSERPEFDKVSRKKKKSSHLPGYSGHIPSFDKTVENETGMSFGKTTRGSFKASRRGSVWKNQVPKYFVTVSYHRSWNCLFGRVVLQKVLPSSVLAGAMLCATSTTWGHGSWA